MDIEELFNAEFNNEKLYSELDIFEETDLFPVFSYLPFVRKVYEERFEGKTDEAIDIAKELCEDPTKIDNFNKREDWIYSRLEIVRQCAYAYAKNYDNMVSDHKEGIFYFIAELSDCILSDSYDEDDDVVFYYGILNVIQFLVEYFQQTLDDD